MGDAVANQTSQKLNKDLLIHLPYDKDNLGLQSLWESICQEI